jgi:putative Mg2+ transporter-C (MgtC) family protein
MHVWLADPPFFGGPGQGTRQIIELFVAFGLTSLIGWREIGQERRVRTQTIVGTAAALILLVSSTASPTCCKTASSSSTRRVCGPNRLGASAFRRGHHHLPPRSVHGLTTAAAVWGVPAIAWQRGPDCCCLPSR